MNSQRKSETKYNYRLLPYLEPFGSLEFSFEIGDWDDAVLYLSLIFVPFN